MASPAPRVTIARPSRSNGVLSIPASATQRKQGPAHETQSSRANAARLKIIIRRLPPALTQTEFEETLGDDWKAGGNKVDWAVYRAGKASKDPAKPSRPSRAYLHLTKQEHIASLSDHVRSIAFDDAKGSSKDSALLGPPSVEFAPYGRVPNSRPRKDARQGTIDQDPEFIDFLESLTNPVAKSGLGDQENDGTGKSKEKVTVTPLVQFLKDKKANKGKENAAPSKGGKHGRQDSKDVKALNDSDIKTAAGTATIASPKKRSAQAVKVEQAARDAVKVLNKQAANASKGVASSQTPAVPPTTKSPVVIANNTANTALGDKKRERGNASAAAKILQRDLGLGTNVGGRGGRRGPIGHVARTAAANASIAHKQDAVAPQVSSPLATASAPESTTPATATSASESTTATKPPVQPPSGPAASRQIAKAPTTFNNNASSHTTTTKPTSPPSTATQAFLKHANPSQGITEPLLEEAFATFGNINKVEIDKKKGFAYVDFAEPESLQKAIKASPIKVAQGQVVVLERKTGSSLQARNLRGGGAMMGNRGGGMPMGGRGPMRGRGGFGRGGMKMPNVNSRSATGTGTTPPKVAVAPQTPTASPSTGEGSTAPDHPAAVTSASTAPAD